MTPEPPFKTTLVIKYNDLFDDYRSDVEDILKQVPSVDVIGDMTFINDVLEKNGNDTANQLFILKDLCSQLSESDRNTILVRARQKFDEGKKLFWFPFTVELLNREFSNFRSGNRNDIPDNALKTLKAYTSLVSETAEREYLLSKQANERLKNDIPFLQALWPYLIKQHEFVTVPNPFYESFRGFSLLNFLESHSKYREKATAYFQAMGCSSGNDYEARLVQLVKKHLERGASLNPNDHFVTIRLSDYQPILESLFINPDTIRNDIKKQLDYVGMKECPLFRTGQNEFTVPFWYFLYAALFNGVIFSFYKKSGIANLFEKKQTAENNMEPGLPDFKAELAKEFSEFVLFRKTICKCFEREGEYLKFFDDGEEFNPDCYYRKGNDVFLIEFKDNLLSADIIQSGSYEAISKAIDDKFVSALNKKGRLVNKGVYQLARNIELLVNEKDKLWSIDEDARKQNISIADIYIHPIIVQTNIYFDIPGINEYLDEKIQHRLEPVRSSFKSIEPFTTIHFSYFFYKFLLFSDSKLHLVEELKYYHTSRAELKAKAQKTDNMDDWLNTYAPFSYIDSPAYILNRFHRQDELLSELRKLWNIKKGVGFS